MPRPAGLVSLFWGNTALSMPKVDASTQVDIQLVDSECQTVFEEGNVCVSCQTSLDADTDWNHEVGCYKLLTWLNVN